LLLILAIEYFWIGKCGIIEALKLLTKSKTKTCLSRSNRPYAKDQKFCGSHLHLMLDRSFNPLKIFSHV
jgi:hypothetical protein